MNWTPYVINVVLHHHARVGPFEYKHAPIYPNTIEMLLKNGLLVEDGENYTTTDLGKALVKAWCDTPIPVVKYVDPRFPTSEGE